MVAFSCANLPDTLIEDELFGHERGAFTGAMTMRRGRVETADQGTLFLDEIGDLGLSLQPKLLRVLQERKFERLGGNATVDVNIRLICATNRNLSEMVQQGKFRDDLYYRLNVVQLHLPPLRERREDIPLLVQYFLETCAHQFNKKAKRFSPAAMHALEEYEWPGNVRELLNAVQRAVVLSEGPTVDIRHLPAGLRNEGDGPVATIAVAIDQVLHDRADSATVTSLSVITAICRAGEPYAARGERASSSRRARNDALRIRAPALREARAPAASGSCSGGGR